MDHATNRTDLSTSGQVWNRRSLESIERIDQALAIDNRGVHKLMGRSFIGEVMRIANRKKSDRVALGGFALCDIEPGKPTGSRCHRSTGRQASCLGKKSASVQATISRGRDLHGKRGLAKLV